MNAKVRHILIHRVFIGCGTTIYILRVTDEYGGCSATYTYNVIGATNTMTLALPPKIQTCYGDTIVLQAALQGKGASLPPGYQAAWSHRSFQSFIPLTSTPSGGLVINEHAARQVGTYPFTVVVTELATGCQTTGVTNLTILDKWKYTGYQSNPETRFAVLGAAVPLWKDENQKLSLGTLLSPNIPKPLVTWSGPTPEKIMLKHNIPGNATFQPSEEHPQLVMTVVDQSTGCSHKFASTHYIVTRQQPDIQIKLDNYVICSGQVEGQKIKVQFDPHIIGLPPANMPLYVLLSCPDNIISNYPDNAGGLVQLKLSGASGIYEADLALKNMPSGQHIVSFTYSGAANNQIWGEKDINANVEVMVVDYTDYAPGTVLCGFLPDASAPLPTPTEGPKDLVLRIIPTPFQADVAVQFAFESPEAQAVDLELYDVTGQKIALLRQWNNLKSGVYSEKINMEPFAPGMYTYLLRLSNGRYLSRQSVKI